MIEHHQLNGIQFVLKSVDHKGMGTVVQQGDAINEST
jgi:hypothetical protein